MFRILSVLLMAVAVVAFSTSVSTNAADDKPTTIEGTVCCGKCELKKSAKCAVTIVDDKKNVYWFDTASSKKYHGDVCQATKAGTVTGTVGKDGEKMTIKVTELKYK